MMRITNDIVNDIPNEEFNYWNSFEKQEHLFLFEFAGLGRNELFSNTLNDFIVTNYNLTDENTFEYNGITRFFFSKSKLEDSLKQFFNIISFEADSHINPDGTKSVWWKILAKN